MAAICGSCSSMFPLYALASSSSSFQVRTSRSFKVRDNWSRRHLKIFGLGGIGLYSSNLNRQCRYRYLLRLKSIIGSVNVRASNLDAGAGSYEDGGRAENQRHLQRESNLQASTKLTKFLSRLQYPLSIVGILLVCLAIFSAITFPKAGPLAIVTGLAKSGFTAAFTLIFISEIGDKSAKLVLLWTLNKLIYAIVPACFIYTFFIAALLAMQYDKMMVLCGSMGALSLMTILSVVIGRIFQSVPAQFQTTLPVGEYAAVALLAFFGLKSIKDAWQIPSNVDKNSVTGTELGEFVEAEELVKEKVSKNLSGRLEVLWKSFSLVFFAEWGDRSMLATIALGAAQSPWGVACGAIAGHLFATSLAILGGAFLANYISEKLVGYMGGALFLVFAAATLFGYF